MSRTFPIRISTPKVEGALQTSKALKFQVLLEKEEVEELLDHLGHPFFVSVAEPVKEDEAVLSSDRFAEKYAAYVSSLFAGDLSSLSQFRRCFSSALSMHLDPFYAMALESDKYLIKPVQPVVQLQAHSFFYSDLDKKFHPMVLSQESISWGLQFSYPQYFQDLKTHKIHRVSEVVDFANNALFSKLSKWMRGATLATPFEVGGVRTNATIRIGKKALIRAKEHPQLKKKGICLFSKGS